MRRCTLPAREPYLLSPRGITDIHWIGRGKQTLCCPRHPTGLYAAIYKQINKKNDFGPSQKSICYKGGLTIMFK